jgi:hypothetical protein
MKTILILSLVSLFVLMGTFIIEEKMIDKLSDNNRFKIWWRNHVIGDANNMDL